MDIAVVLIVATAAGAAVYRLILGPGESERGAGFLPGFDPPAHVSAPAVVAGSKHGIGSLPIDPPDRSWRTRVLGLTGILILVPLGGAGFAVILYELAHIVNKMLASFVKGG